MHSLRTVALGAALVLGLAATAGAQSSQGTEQGRRGAAAEGQKGGRMNRPARALMRGIDLSDTQREQIRAVHQRYQPQHAALRAKVRDARQAEQRPDSAARAGMRADLRSLMQREHTEIRGVLSAEQQKTFDANVVRMQERGEKGRGWRRGR